MKMSNGNLIQFAAQKLRVVKVNGKYYLVTLDDENFPSHYAVLENFDPCTWEWMGKGLEIMFDEGLLYCIQSHKFIIWPENEVGDETVVSIESVEKTPDAFWQCWMAVEGVKQ